MSRYNDDIDSSRRKRVKKKGRGLDQAPCNTLELDQLLFDFKHIVDRHGDRRWLLDDINATSNMILLYEGCIHVEVNGQVKEAKKGDLIYFKKGVSRLAYTSKNKAMKCLAICCDMRRYNPLTDQVEVIDIDMPWLQSINSSIVFSKLKKYFQTMETTWQEKDPYMNYELNSRYNLILKTLVTWQENDLYNYGQEYRVKEVIDYMAKHLNQSITVVEISDAIGVSPSYISRVFKGSTGMTLMNYFNQMKVDASKDYLGAGYLVSECALMLGFSDVYYFSKVFKQYEGIAPSLYGKGIV